MALLQVNLVHTLASEAKGCVVLLVSRTAGLGGCVRCCKERPSQGQQPIPGGARR
jgi:hypothetical protein